MAGRDWPFVRVGDARSTVLEHADGRADDAGYIVFGEAGTGKTSLAKEWFRRQHRAVWLMGAPATQDVPFGAFAPLLRGGAADDGRGAWHRVYDQLADADRGIALVVDDAHRIDAVSAAFLHRIVLDRLAPVIVTLRAGGTRQTAVEALWKEDLLGRLDLTALDLYETRTVCRVSLGGEIEPRAARELHERSGGNLLYLRHLLAAALTSGALAEDRGVWRLTGGLSIDHRLRDLVSLRLAEVSASAEEVAALVVLSEPVSLTVLEVVCGAAALLEAETAGLIVVDDDHLGERIVRIGHPLLGEYLRESIGTVRARQLRGAIVRAAMSPERNEADVVRLSLLSLDSTLHLAPEVLVAAAQEAIALGDLSAGERLARTAVSRGAGPIAGIMLAHAMSWQGRGHDADDVLNAYRPVSPGLAVAWSVPRIANKYWTMRDRAGARADLDDARRTIREESGRGDLDALEAAMSLHDGDLTRAVSLADPLVGDSRSGDAARVWAAGTLAVSTAFSGSGRDPVALGRDIFALRAVFQTGFVGLAVDLGEALTEIFTHAAHRGDGENLEVPLIPHRGEPGAVAGMLALCRGLRASARGHVNGAVQELENAVECLEREDSNGWSSLARIQLAGAYADSGDVTAARAVLSRDQQGAQERHRLLAPLALLADSVVTAGSGNVTGAVMLARRAADDATAAGQHGVALTARHHALRYGDISIRQQLERSAARCEGPLAEVMIAHGRALAAGDGESLMAVATRFEQHGHLLLAMEATAEAHEHLDRVGARARAADAVAAVARFDPLLERPRTVIMRRYRSPLPISRREREVGELARTLSNREISRVLGISVRTVEGHVFNACAKVGLSSRTALADALARTEMLDR